MAFFRFVFFLLMAVANLHCTYNQQTEETTTSAKNTTRYAKGFSIYEKEDGYLLHVHQLTQNIRDTISFHLSYSPDRQKGAIKIPIESFACTSTTHVAMAAALGVLPKLKAVAGAEYVYHPEARQAIEAGRIIDLGPDGHQDPETLLVLGPDLLMVSSYSFSQSGGLEQVQALGVAVVPNAEWLESSPLGRAEWIRFMAPFVGEAALADSLFKGIAHRYSQLKERASNWDNRPKVMVGMSFQGNWFVPAGESYTAQLIADAGGDYIWSGLPGNGSQPLDFEQVFAAAQQADVWINLGTANSLNDLSGKEPRIAHFPPYLNKRVFNHNRRLNENGWNDFFEGAAIGPDVVLADLMAIFHPDSLPDHSFYYYQPLL